MSASTIGMAMGVVYSVALPLGLAIWWKRRTGEKLWCFVAGAICFVLFAMVLEQLLHRVCIVGDNALSRAIRGSAIAYTLYGSLAAGVFEETGRLFGYKVLLRSHRERECAVAYGIGHGGMEVFLILGVTYLVYLLAKCGVPIGDAETAAKVLEAANAIPIGTTCVAMLERVSALMAHIGLSMVVFPAARQRGRLWLWPAAILMHALLDAPAALYQLGVIASIGVIEGAALVIGAAYLLIGRKVLDGYTE